ncbi:uncharacterized protein LOC34624410 [Cyclospora cayetanensis]|uniref:Uncharacterized protein LOC34624410 n=1 Tax=Cyclospora cayetanensis TaxID=88456 RepID=A0A6P6S0W3_9EIME|nr:uncharacterized protein LOC34624410 [Cyclospora cayetanensis]
MDEHPSGAGGSDQRWTCRAPTCWSNYEERIWRRDCSAGESAVIAESIVGSLHGAPITATVPSSSKGFVVSEAEDAYIRPAACLKFSRICKLAQVANTTKIKVYQFTPELYGKSNHKEKTWRPASGLRCQHAEKSRGSDEAQITNWDDRKKFTGLMEQAKMGQHGRNFLETRGFGILPILGPAMSFSALRSTAPSAFSRQLLGGARRGQAVRAVRGPQATPAPRIFQPGQHEIFRTRDRLGALAERYKNDMEGNLGTGLSGYTPKVTTGIPLRGALKIPPLQAPILPPRQVSRLISRYEPGNPQEGELGKQRNEGARKRQEEEAERQQKEKERKQQEEEARKRREEEERRRQEEEEARRRQQEEAQRRQQEEARRRQEEEARKRREEEERRRQQEEEARRRQQEEARRRQEEEARKRREEEERRRQQEEARRRQQEEARRRQEEEARKRREEGERRRQQEAEARRRQQEEAQRRQQEEARKRREEEERRRQEEAEARRRREEAEARRRREEEEARRKREAELEKKREEAIRAIPRAEPGSKPMKKVPGGLQEALSKALQRKAGIVTSAPPPPPPAVTTQTAEQLLAEAQEMFREIDEAAEKKQAESNPSIESGIPAEHMQKALAVFDSKGKPHFTKGPPKIIVAKYDDPRTGCHTMSTNWSPCSTNCGQGKRVSFTRELVPKGCLTTVHEEICVNTTGCICGKMLYDNLLGSYQGLPDAAREELGRLVSKSLNLRRDGNRVCLQFDTGYTVRAYNDEGLLGTSGTGYHIRMLKESNNVEKSCDLSTEHKYVTRTELDMLQGHNEIRGKHNVAPLKWNPMIAANVKKYLEYQNKYQGCRMEHSPVTTRTLPGIPQGTGENLMTCCSPGKIPPDVASMWASEAYCYRHGKIGNPCTGYLGPKCSTEKHAHGLMTGHYTAVAWDKSQQVGCAYTVCDRKCEGNRNIILIGCQYNPGGNIIGAYPYSVESAREAMAVYPSILPGAPGDAESRLECEKFRMKMEQENPRVDITRKKSSGEDSS